MYGLYQIVYFTIIDILNTLKSPFFILVFLIIYFQYYQIRKLEKRYLGFNRSPLLKAAISTFYGILGGIITTVAFIYLEVVAIPMDYLYILFVVIIMSFFDQRFMCFSYGGAIVSLSNLILGFPEIKIPSVMSVVAVLHIVESLLILVDGWRHKIPMYFVREHMTVGGFQMSRFWPVPFVIFVGDGLIYPVTLMAVLSYGDYSISTYPRKKALETSLLLFIYSIVLLYISKTVENLLLAPIFALVGHEFIIYFNKKKEEIREPIFIPLNKGVRVIEVIPGTIAHKVGLKIGDIVLKINGVEINSERDLRDFMKVDFNRLKIEYFNLKSGLMEKNYHGIKKSLGLIVVPRDF
ncbi:MAG TPA: PDZ domain-containing protein [Tissierellaceae bacterium]